MTEESIRNIIALYYPWRIPPYEEEHAFTEENQRLLKLLEKEIHNDSWKSWVAGLRQIPNLLVLDNSIYNFACPSKKLRILYRKDPEFIEIKLNSAIIAPLFVVKVNELEKTNNGVVCINESTKILYPFENKEEYILSNTSVLNSSIMPIIQEIYAYQKICMNELFPLSCFGKQIIDRYTNSSRMAEAPIFNFVFEDEYF